MPILEDSPLSLLSPRKKPDCGRLLNDLKDALNRASAINIWNRVQHNHYTRYLWWPGSVQDTDWSVRKMPIPGQKPPLPWPNAANLKVRICDAVVKDWCDLIGVADSRAMPHILPTMMDPADSEKMDKAGGWGAVYEYYAERCELELHRAKSAWREIAWEYGHSLLYVGWRRQKEIRKRTLDAQTVFNLIAAIEINAGVDPRTASADAAAAIMFEEETLVAALLEIDPDMSIAEAKRVAAKLPDGKPVDYSVAVVVSEQPDVKALINGLHAFCPPETTDAQSALFWVLPEWVSDVEMRARVQSEGWDEEAVEKIIKDAVPGRATFFDTMSFGTYLAQPINWALTGGMIGMGVAAWDPVGETNCRQWQLLKVLYRATDPATGVPVQYETIFHPDQTDYPVLHEWSTRAKAGYPICDYKREESAPTLWDSRGVGEVVYSEQQEMKEMADFCYNNAQITLRPPYEVSSRSEMSSKELTPGLKVITSSSFGNGLKKVDIGGDSRPAIEVQKMALYRVNDYFKRGNSDEMDPIAKTVAQQARINDYMKCAKRAMRMLFSTIQQFAPANIKAAAVNGEPSNLDLTSADIQGDFSVFMEFDVTDLDPKAIEARAKMVREFMAPLDNQGAIQVQPLLKMLMMCAFPKAWKSMIADVNEAKQQQTKIAVDNALRVLNGIEAEYVSGGNPKLRAQITKSIFTMPTLDENGQPMVDENTGQVIPGRPSNLYNTSPDVRALADNLMKHEEFEAAQQDNREVGRKGVKQMQEPGERPE